MMIKNLKQTARGFSFTEMSVVLASVTAIIVLTLGSVSMVKKTKYRNILTHISEFTESIEQFEKKYGSLPGDIADITGLSGTTGAGNGNGAIDTADEALDAWHHLSVAGLIEGSFDGNSSNLPGIGVPKADIEGGGYKIIAADDTGFNNDVDSSNDIPRQALIIELAGFSSTDDSLPVLTAEDAKIIDERADDGNPLTGFILAEGLNNDCVTAGGEYNLSEKTASCRVLFIIKGKNTHQNAPQVLGSCNELGQTRQVSDVNRTCPKGYVGNIIETCRIDSDNQGVWEVTDRNCAEVKCDGGSYGDTRNLACINGLEGFLGTVEKCTENGVWTKVSSDCEIKTTVPCPVNGNVQKKGQACNWGENGYMLQTCTDNKWAAPTAGNDTCTSVLSGSECDSASLAYGETDNTSKDCDVHGADYIGDVNEVCTVAGTMEETSIGSSCVPDYSGSCTFGVSADKDIGCPPGKKGEHILTCVDATTDYWTTLRNSCEPITCAGGSNIGTSRIKEGARCPNGANGTVMEYCDETGTWQPAFTNCVTGICEEPKDNSGNAYWPTTTASNSATGTCIEGYEESGGTPTRNCNADGTWSNTVNNQCVRITCPAIPAANYNNTVTTDDDAIYPVTNAGDRNISAVTFPNQCQNSGYLAPEGYPVADCNINGDWENERISCKGTPCGDTSAPAFASMILWFDASDNCRVFSDDSCTTTATPDSDSVACFKDKKSNFEAKQTNPSKRPAYVTSSSANSLNTVDFSGTAGEKLSIADDNGLDTSDFTRFFAVVKFDNFTTGNSILSKTLSGVARMYHYHTGSGTSPNQFIFSMSNGPSAERSVTSGNVIDSGQYMLLGEIKHGAVNQTYKNGVQTSYNAWCCNPTVTAGTTDAEIGSNDNDTKPMDGEIGEIILIGNSGANIPVRVYLADKWGITIP